MCAIVTTSRQSSRAYVLPALDPRRPWDDTAWMNALDLLLIVLVVLSGLSGYRRGFALQGFGFGGLLVGLVAGALLAPSTWPAWPRARTRARASPSWCCSRWPV